MKKMFTILFLLFSVSFMFGQTNIYVAPAPAGSNSNSGTIGSPYETIQYALDQVDPVVTTIVNLANGTYTEAGISLNASGAPHYGNYSDLTIQGSSASSVIIQGHANEAAATDRVFNFSGSSTITLNNLTIQHGYLSASGADGAGIGGRWNSLTINNCHIKSNIANTSYGMGAGINAIDDLYMTNCTVSNNTANYGGGVSASGDLAVFTNCTFSNNQATAVGDAGGALALFTQGNYTITNCTIANNSALIGNGGGVYLQSTSYVTLSIKNTILAKNSAGSGNYLDFTSSGSITVNDNGNNIVHSQYESNISSVGTLIGSDLSTTLADNSTLTGTPTLALDAANDAINTGNDVQGSHPVATPTNDQRNATRVGTSDIGAYEYGGTVPVELISFNAKIDEEAIVLNWTTATEVNNYGFEIEKNNGSEWEVIAFVQGHGNSNSPKEYSYIDNSASGSVSYRLKQIDTDGAFEYSNVVTVSMELTKEYKLIQNYPNPFNPSTSIAFTIPTNGFVTLKVYNTIGEEVAELINENIDAGNHNVVFDASNLPTGAYFYRITAENFL